MSYYLSRERKDVQCKITLLLVLVCSYMGLITLIWFCCEELTSISSNAIKGKQIRKVKRNCTHKGVHALALAKWHWQYPWIMRKSLSTPFEREWIIRGSGLRHSDWQIRSCTWRISKVSKASTTSGAPVGSVASLQQLGVGGRCEPQ